MCRRPYKVRKVNVSLMQDRKMTKATQRRKTFKTGQSTSPYQDLGGLWYQLAGIQSSVNTLQLLQQQILSICKSCDRLVVVVACLLRSNCLLTQFEVFPILIWASE